MEWTELSNEELCEKFGVPPHVPRAWRRGIISRTFQAQLRQLDASGGRVDVPKMIKEARLRRGHTQHAAANAIGVCTRTLREWELGKYYPSPLSFIKLKKYLHAG